MKSLETRRPAVAGHFYPSDPGELAREISGFLDPSASRSDAIACVLPHAGYMFSGPVAGATLSRIAVKDNVFLLGPNHTGYGTAFSVMVSGAWETPLGRVPVNAGLAGELVKSCGIFFDDQLAHLREHSLEVQLPILQTVKKDFSIVPLAIASDDDEALRQAGTSIGHLIQSHELAGKTLIVASSDMTHYEPKESAVKKDRLAIEAILALDERRLLRVVRENDISMCGYAPVAVMLTAARMLGASRAELIKYQTSGDTNGDLSSVVGYAGIAIY